MGRRAIGLLLVTLGCIAHDAAASTSCAASVRGLRELLADPAFALRWRETTMTDGRPLVLTILERDGTLVLEFVKSGEGLWAESGFAICRRGRALEARAEPGQVRVGPAAGWLTRLAFAGGASIRITRLAPDRLRVEAAAWAGTFLADPPPAPAGKGSVTIGS